MGGEILMVWAWEIKELEINGDITSADIEISCPDVFAGCL
jgi:hypothetical protein